MNDWELAYVLLVVQVSLLSILAAVAYLASVCHPAIVKRVLGFAGLMILALTVVALLPLPNVWSFRLRLAVTAREAPHCEPTSLELPLDTALPTIADLPVAPAQPKVVARPVSPARQTVQIPWATLLKLLLLAGGLVAACRLVRGVWITRQVLKRSRRVTDTRLLVLLEEIRQSLGCRHVELRESTEIINAASVGWRRPVLLLAADHHCWSETELRAVLAHELTHARSNDYLSGIVTRFTMLLYYYHPLVRWLGTRFLLAQETFADATAAPLVGGRQNYLAALSRIALRQDGQLPSPTASAFLSSTTFLMRRIKMLEQKEVHRSTVPRFQQWIILTCLAIGALALSALRVPAQEDPEVPVSPAAALAQARPIEAELLPPTPETVTFTLLTVHEGKTPWEMKWMCYKDFGARMECGGISTVIRNTARLAVNEPARTASITTGPSEPDDFWTANLCDHYRQLMTGELDQAKWKREELGKANIHGKPAVGYRLVGNTTVTTIWADPTTLLPIQVEMITKSIPNVRTIETDFVFNAPLDKSLFSLDPPDGYTVRVLVDVPDSSPEESDLIETLRRRFEYDQTTFPDVITGYRAIAVALARHQNAMGAAPTNSQKDAHRTFIRELSRGLRFVDDLPPEADAHYAGKGVERGDKTRPIFWYRPTGSQKYRVIRADLSVIESESPPRIAGAQNLNDWCKAEIAATQPTDVEQLADLHEQPRTSSDTKVRAKDPRHPAPK